MKKWIREYNWVIWLGGTLPLFTGFGLFNSWQWWAIIIPTIILVACGGRK